MHKIKNIFPIIYDFENLFNAYKAGIKCKRYRPDVMAYTDKLEENLIELQNEFIWQTYTVGRYNIFYVYEPKKRMIMSLQFKDRVAQHAIYSQLNPYFEKQFIHCPQWRFEKTCEVCASQSLCRCTGSKDQSYRICKYTCQCRCTCCK